MKDCKFCGHERRNCSCPDDPKTGGPLTGRDVFRAACAMQRLGLPITTGKKRPDVEREFSTGGINVRPYTKPDTKSTPP